MMPEQQKEATTAATSDLGDLRPFESLQAWVDEWHSADAAKRPAGDPTVHALALIGARLKEALVEARSGVPELTVEQFAAQEGVTPEAIYMRRRRGKLPQARRRGKRLMIPANAA